MESIISQDKRFITLDFSNVKTLGPSVFTTLTEVCEELLRRGKEIEIYLPYNADILSAGNAHMHFPGEA